MTRKSLFLSTALGVIATLGVGDFADAAIILSNGNVEGIDLTTPSSHHPNPPLVDITRLSFSTGRVYTNQESGTPFAVGSTIRSVGVYTLSSAINGTNAPFALPNDTNLNIIYSVEGEIIDSGIPGIANALFTTGRAFLVSEVAGFNLNDPTTWNFGEQFAEFALLPQQQVIDGALYGITGHPTEPSSNDTGGFELPASVTNVSGVNTAIAGAVQGTFLFGEDSTSDQNNGIGFTNPGLGVHTGDDWLRDVDVASLFPKVLEAVVAVTHQTALSSPSQIPALNAAGLQVLDDISVEAGLSAVFTTGGYDPRPLGAITGDFVANLEGSTYIGYSDVPEPSAVLVWSVLSAGTVLVVYRRRNRNDRSGNVGCAEPRGQ